MQRKEIKVRTKPAPKNQEVYKWWEGNSKEKRAQELVSTALYIRDQQQYRFRQASVHAKLYSNVPLQNFAGQSFKQLNNTNMLPLDRPTMNVVQSCVDTLTSKITQNRPKPVFLTDNGDYKERKLAKQLNNFIAGELYQTKAYEHASAMFRDALIFGTGVLKVLEQEERVCIERVLPTELYVDSNDAFYGHPRCLYQFKLIDRDVLKGLFPSNKTVINNAETAYPDNSGDSQRTVADQILVVEAWHLPSSKDASDGKHIIACSAGSILEEQYDCDYFPFVFFNYSSRVVGFFGQGLSEQLTGTQIEINKLLMTISQSLSVVGVPRVFVEDGSKVVKAHLTNEIGAIITYRGTKPSYEVAPSVHPEMYAQLNRLIEFAYQQSGISALNASGKKPSGLNSGEAIRNYNDLQSERFAAIERKYNQLFIDLAYQIIYKAKEIAERTGKYQTVYPNKNGTKEIDLPNAELLENPFVIQCYDTSSLPKEPSGRLEKVTEMLQAGIIDVEEGRRLLDFADLQQSDKLATAAQERIYQALDNIVEDGKYEAPDPYINIMLAEKIVVQYYNLYAACKLEEEKLEMLRLWQAQIADLKAQLMPPAQMLPTAQDPMAVPNAAPTSSLLPV